ncbi:fimbria/pilus outer membrane usher protein [Vibrio sp. SCSIO 43140]|uniref:fimbria/pilus outer membrane usher protein n=1 Tax=Vibrio sp. SCSIO 43140 TaxID=2819100 RepID=UPI00207545AB|nr:fimbria/pilus outer membrane usher protein [Vibrio sp. SCSIO 43140]USD61317.1 fimbria/pilus outer membrane usher protein [Vibrio sp. SCSIO 43140]
MKVNEVRTITLFILLGFHNLAIGHDFNVALLQGDVDVSNLASESEFIPSQKNDDVLIVDLYLNEGLKRTNVEVRSAFNSSVNRNEPCLIESQLLDMDLSVPKSKSDCYFVSNLVHSSKWEYDSSLFKLKYTVPQSLLKRKIRGDIAPSKWDKGISALFVKHNTNYYVTNYHDAIAEHYVTSSLKSGVNLGLWQFRHDGFFRKNNNTSQYNVVNSYLKRPISGIGGVLTLGETSTSDGLFSSLSFTGSKLETDKRMWPQSRLGYAPEVIGQALTNAKVSIVQNGQVIREVTVPPGPFVISDLNDTESQGDLQVIIRESDGSVNTYTVPYSSVPLSMRPGNSVYSLVFGDVRGYGSENSLFVQGSLQNGASNQLTINSGFRLGYRYQSYLTGGVLSTSVGAFGIKGIYAFTQVHENEPTTNGWQLETSYGRTFKTDTHVSLLAYRFSSEGYMDLSDVLGKRMLNAESEYLNDLDSFRQRNRFTLSVSQSLSNFGTLNVSGSLVDYYNTNKSSINYQASYNSSWRNVSYNVSMGRQYNLSTKSASKYEDILSVGLSIPFDIFERRSSVGFNYTTNSAGESATSTLAGTIGSKAQVAYSAFSGLENSKSTYGVNVSTKTKFGGVSIGSVSGQGYTRLSAGLSGTILGHQEGLTFGPYTSESFALIHAEGGRGLEVLNGQGAEIDDNGYAILPSIPSYRSSKVALQASSDTYKTVELKTDSKSVVPYSGAIVKVTFETISGVAVLMTVKFEDDQYPPIGAVVYDDRGNKVGVVGQRGQAYARLKKDTKTVSVHWNNGRKCLINIRGDIFSEVVPLINMSSVCEVVE